MKAQNVCCLHGWAPNRKKHCLGVEWDDEEQHTRKQEETTVSLVLLDRNLCKFKFRCSVHTAANIYLSTLPFDIWFQWYRARRCVSNWLETESSWRCLYCAEASTCRAKTTFLPEPTRAIFKPLSVDFAKVCSWAILCHWGHVCIAAREKCLSRCNVFV